MQTIPSQDQLNRIENRLQYLTQLVELLLGKMEEEGIFQKLVSSERFQREMREDLEAFKKDPHNLPTCMRHTNNKKHHDLSSLANSNRIEKDFLRIITGFSEEEQKAMWEVLRTYPKGSAATHWTIKRCIRTSGNWIYPAAIAWNIRY